MATNPSKKNGRLDPNAVYADAGVIAIAPAPTNGRGNGGAKVMEEAMGKAIMDALAEGIPINSPLIKERMLAARRAARG
jgi:hypothetical protein